MPNIIEQQDLLKGLPDARLAMLLQNPVADIPPFLVAAEAQRRQSIRQQFAGSEPKESVVDTLTKQIANVPQNIQSPAQTPSRIPPTPQMQGVMALQQQPAAQQPQQMRSGGMVQRYDVGGLAGTIYGPTPDGSAEQIARTYMFLNPGMTYEEALQRAGIGTELPRPTVGQIAAANSGRDITGMGGVGNYSILRKPSEAVSEPAIEEKAIGTKEPATSTPPLPFRTGMPAEDRRAAGRMPPPPIADTPSVTETAAPEEDKFRAQHEALLATQEPSNWDKAQRWFAMAEQFLDPSKTTMQSVAGAGRAFSEMSAEQQRAQRQAEFEGKKALLEYDIGKAQTASAAAAEEAKAKREFEQKMKERGTPSADVVIPALNRRIVEINEQIAKLREGLGPNIPVTPENQAAINTLMEEKSILNRQLATIMARGGFTNRTLVTEEDLNSLGTL